VALVGEAHILVRAITTNVEKDIRKAFSNVNGNAASNAGASLGASFSRGLRNNIDGNVFSRLASNIAELAPNADGAREAFQGMVRSSYVAGTAISVLLGAISSLIGGLGALVGAAGQAAVGLVAVAGAAVALKVGFSVAGMAFKGISQAVSAATSANKNYSDSLRKAKFDAEEAALAVDDAALALERAIEARNRVADLPVNSRARREADLNVKKAELALRKAKDAEKNAGKAAAGGTAATDPYAGLTPSQKEFAKFLVSLKAKMDEIKEAAAKGFLPLLKTQMERLIQAGALEIIRDRFYDIGRGMGFAAEKFTDIVMIRGSLKKLDEVLKNISEQLPPMGTIFGNLFDGLLSVLRLADPAVRNFVGYLETKSKNFADYFTVGGDPKNSSISKFFVESEKMLERFFGIFGNIFKTIGTLVEANFGPGSGGEIMVTWLEKTTSGWANMGRTFDGKVSAPFKQWFSDAATNTTKILDAIGALIKEFLKLGDMPEIGQTFDILKQGAPAMGELMRAGIKAGPSLANLVVQITRILVALADSEGPKVFFDTLTAFATKVADILESEVAQKILKAIGGFLAFALAIGTVTKVAKFFGNVFMGVFGNIAQMGAGFMTNLGKFQGFLVQMNLGAKDLIGKGGFLNTLFGNLGVGLSRFGRFLVSFPGVAIIATLVTLFVDLYNNSETFRKTVSDTLSGIGAAFGRLWDSLMGLFDQLFGGDGLGGIMEAIRPITELILGTVFPLIGGVISIIIDTVATAINFITTLVRTIMNGIKPLVSGIMDLFKGNFGPGLAKIFGGIGIMLLGIIEGIVNAIIGGINVVLGVVNGLLKAIGDGPVGQFLKTVTGGAINLSNVKLKVDYVDWTSKAKANLAKVGGTKMATGGTVFPTSGGSMVTVAEAGRPERIEPLHPNGLSDRDLAIINKLSGGGGPQIQVTVNPSAKMDERELAMQVSRQIAYEIRKGGY
jgi:phage-related protein